MRPPRLDPLIHQPTRLQILAVLFRNREVLSRDLRQALGLTPGNLASHVATLEESGYIKSGPVLVDLSFQVRHRITEAGAEAFRDYLRSLRSFLEEVDGPAAAPAADQGGRSERIAARKSPV